jgi:Ricin-type beta-trefoil lectin domain
MWQKSFKAKRTRSRALKATAFAALLGGSMALFGSPAARAAVLTTGGGPGSVGPSFGGTVCADVAGGSLNPGTKVQAWNCNAAPNQQFEFYGRTIYTVGAQRCLDVLDDNTSPGTAVDSYLCNGTGAQVWYYINGQIVNYDSGLCLDATTAATGTQLVMNDCNGASSQQWQIK